MENYNDYALPSDTNLKLMQEMYQANSFNRRTSLAKINNLIHNFLSHCYGLENKINVRLRTRLEETKKELEKLIENLTLTFSFTNSINVQDVSKFNLFSALRILTEIINELHTLESNEDKVYYKKFAHNSITSLINHLHHIFEALEGSYVPIYKYI